jgi:phospholipid/cholesterol/gamma-HCH transport system substrate-binding protein
VASYDLGSGALTWDDQGDRVAYDGGAAALYGEDSWKSLLLHPLL